MSAPAYDRAERRARVMQLREQGLTYAQIGERLGVSRGHACELVNDPDGSKADERRARHLGKPIAAKDTARRCSEGCGTRLNVYNTSGVCGACTVELSRRRVAQALAASRQKDEAA